MSQSRHSIFSAFSLKVLLKPARNMKIPFFHRRLWESEKFTNIDFSLWENPVKLIYFSEETSTEKGPFFFRQLKHPQSLYLFFKNLLLPKATAPHQKLPCQDKGIPHNGKTGNQQIWVIFVIVCQAILTKSVCTSESECKRLLMPPYFRRVS